VKAFDRKTRDFSMSARSHPRELRGGERAAQGGMMERSQRGLNSVAC